MEKKQAMHVPAKARYSAPTNSVPIIMSKVKDKTRVVSEILQTTSLINLQLIFFLTFSITNTAIGSLTTIMNHQTEKQTNKQKQTASSHESFRALWSLDFRGSQFSMSR